MKLASLAIVTTYSAAFGIGFHENVGVSLIALHDGVDVAPGRGEVVARRQRVEREQLERDRVLAGARAKRPAESNASTHQVYVPALAGTEVGV